MEDGGYKLTAQQILDGGRLGGLMSHLQINKNYCPRQLEWLSTWNFQVEGLNLIFHIQYIKIKILIFWCKDHYQSLDLLCCGKLIFVKFCIVFSCLYKMMFFKFRTEFFKVYFFVISFNKKFKLKNLTNFLN